MSNYESNVLNEIDYRLGRLREAIPKLVHRRIAVYGIGMNAKRVLDCLKALKIVGLMDSNCVGEFHYGKKVLSDEEVLLLGVDTIVIAAEPDSAKIVFERIKLFCLHNNITILDMYGCNEIELRRIIKQQELDYASLTVKDLQRKIQDYDNIFFSFERTLCFLKSDIENIMDIVSKKAEEKGIIDFKRQRILAQKRLPCEIETKIKDIYLLLSLVLDIDNKIALELMEQEKSVILDQMFPRESMIGLLKYVQNCNKNIFICADILGGGDIVRAFLDRYSIKKYNLIATDRGSLEMLIGKAIRSACSEFGGKKTLFIGDNQENRLILPQLYGADVQLIEDSMTMFWNYAGFGNCRTTIKESEDYPKIVEAANKIYNSPFLDESDTANGLEQISEIIEWNEKCDGVSKHLEQFALPHWNSKEEVEKLIVTREEHPLVSIIIPAHNQFAYTYNCLKSVIKNSGNIKYEIIIIDDYSNDWTKSIDDFVDGIKIIHNEKNLQFVRSCNRASQYAKGKYLLFLNNDTQVQMNWLHSMVKLMESHKEIGLVGSKLIFPDGTLQEAGGIIWNNGSAWNYGRGQNPDAPEFNYVREVDYVTGASMMISKILWDEIGGFDERFVPVYCEDSDLAFEVRRHGKKVVYQPASEVIHFEGMTNGKNVTQGVKKFQTEHQHILYQKWKQVLLKEHYPVGQNVLSACERKGKRKTVLFMSSHIPVYDRAAGSRTIDFYITEFIRRGYIVKFFPESCVPEEPYTYRLQQMGVEVFYGKYFKLNIISWLNKYHAEIDYVFLNFPDVAYKYIDVLIKLGISVRYYGVDLHYLRYKREYELLGAKAQLETSQSYYEKEAYLIQKADVVYYPSQVEVDIVQNEFHKKEARLLMINVYDKETIHHIYQPEKRQGLMFLGNYNHSPNVDAVLWFVHEIFPDIYEQLQIPFYIAGMGIPTEIKNVKMQGIIEIDSPTDQELKKLYQEIKIAVVPLRYGAGMKGKVIEAMYYGVPVVTTTIGAEGIPDQDGALMIADSKEEFIRHICSAYQDENKLKYFSQAGESLITKHFSREAAWNRICEDF